MASGRLGSRHGATGRSPLTGPLSRAVFAIAMLAALAGVLFGAWHIVVGGVINGNGRAAAFGIVLVAVAGGFGGGLWMTGRRLRGP